jgi:hypothetical protein
MAKLKQICDRLAFSVDLPQNELAAYERALCTAGLIPHGRDTEATPEATAWLILAVLCGPEPKRAVERAREVAQFRNHKPSVVSFSASDGWADHRRPFLAADPELSFIAALTSIINAQRGHADPVLPRLTVSDIAGDQIAVISYPIDKPASFDLPPDCRGAVWESYFSPESQFPRDDGKIQRVSALMPAALAAITRLLSLDERFQPPPQSVGFVMPAHMRVQ